MKIIKMLLPLAFICCMTGCIEINEQIDVKTNGSGQWVTRMDMGQLLDLMQNYIGKDEMEKQLPRRMMDTTIYFKSLTDTATSLSAEKKALVKDGTIGMKLNMDEKIFKTEMIFPFKNLNDLQQLTAALGDGSLGTGQLLKGLNPSGKGETEGGNNMQSPDISQFNAVYDFKSKDGMISRKLNPEKWKALQENPQFGQMKEGSNMGIEIPYTITINLPRPVAKIDNAIAKLSPDKKTVTLKYNLIEMLNAPEKFEYTIAY
jgi:hypothetical protein